MDASSESENGPRGVDVTSVEKDESVRVHKQEVKNAQPFPGGADGPVVSGGLEYSQTGDELKTSGGLPCSEDVKSPDLIGPSSRDAEELNPHTPLMKIFPPVKVNVNKIFDRVTFCLKLIKGKSNYEDLKDTICRCGGSITDTLTAETDMLLVEYNINLPEATDMPSNGMDLNNVEDQAIIAGAVSRNITVAMDIYVWQCILNSDLVPIDDFELIHNVEDGLALTTGKKIVSNVINPSKTPLPISEHSRQSISSSIRSHQQKMHSERYIAQHSSIPQAHPHQRRHSGSKANFYRRSSGACDASSEYNSSDEEPYNAGLSQNIQYTTSYNRDLTMKDDTKQFELDTLNVSRNTILENSVAAMAGYYRLMCSHFRPHKNHWSPSMESPSSQNSYERANSPGHSTQLFGNSPQQRTPSGHRNYPFSNETDYTFHGTPFGSMIRYTTSRAVSSKTEDTFNGFMIESPVVYQSSEHSLSLEDVVAGKNQTDEGHRYNAISDPMFIAKNTANIKSVSQIERLGWSAMLRCILASDFIRTEGRRLLSGLEAENSEPDPGDQIWLEIRANLHGLSVEEELKMVESQRTRMGLVLEEVYGVSFADTSDSTVYDQVTDLLERVSQFKSLYPSLKVLKKKKPSFYSPQLQRRLDALAAWINVKNSISHHLYLLNTWIQSKQWPAKWVQELLNMNRCTVLTSIDTFLKEMPLIRTFEYRIINTLRRALLMVKNAIADNAKTFYRMKLPIDKKGIGMLACFCSNMVVETLKVQIQLSEPFSKHGDNILEQIIENFSEDLSMSIKVKELCREIDQSSEGWLVESCLNPSFDSTISRFLKCYFSLIKQRLIEASEQVFFKEAELVESKWASMMRIRDMIECTEVEIAIQFCRLASELINRLFVYIKYHTYNSVDFNSAPLVSSAQQDLSQGNAQIERLSKHYGRVIDNVKSRARKLLGFSKMLGMEFENCSEYVMTGHIKAFLDKLVESKHILIHTDMGYSKLIIICASAPLLNTPHKIISLLKNCPKRHTAKSDDNCSYVLVIFFKKRPSIGFKWKGGVVQVNISKALRFIDLKKDTVRLVAENRDSLGMCRQKFEAAVLGLVRIIKHQKAHIEPVNKELKKIREATLKLSLAVCPLVEKVASSLTCIPQDNLSSKRNNQDASQVQQTPSGQNFEIIQETYLFASGFVLRSMRRLNKGKKRGYLQSQLLNLSLEWIEFCTNTDETELPTPVKQKAYGWYVTALRFLTNLMNDRFILLLSKGDFARLRKSVSDCLSKILKMCRNVIDVGNCEKINLDYRFDAPPENGITSNIEKRITGIALNNPIIDSLAIPEICDIFHGSISPSYETMGPPTHTQASETLDRSRNKDPVTDTSVASDTVDVTQDLSMWDPIPSGAPLAYDAESGSPPIPKSLNKPDTPHSGPAQQRIGAFERIADVFPAQSPTSTCAGSAFEPHPTIEPKPVAVPLNDPSANQGVMSQSSKRSATNSSKSHPGHTRQDSTKCTPQNYFSQVHKFKTVGRRFISGVENLHMLQKKNRWRQRINELEEKISSNQRSLRIIGKMLDNTSYEDRNISLIARNSGSISVRWRQGPYIGSGSFGDVYVGTNLETGDTMAVKEIKFFDARNLEKLAKFIIEEMNVLQMLHHPNIIDYYGIEVFRDRIYIFMECCKYSLAKVLETARFSDENILKIYTKHLLKGLAYLHGNSIIHRDIKPGNILFSKEGRIKYVDFGASKIFRAEENLIGYSGDTRTLVGTPQYIAPEVVNNEINHKRGSRDVWALGCCILQMFTGKSPWGNTDNDWAIMWRIGTGNDHPEIPPPPIMSEEAVDFLKKCFTRPARERPTAEELMSHKWTANVEGECPDLSYIERLLAESAQDVKVTNYREDISGH